MGYEPNGPLNYSVDFDKGIPDTWPWTSSVMTSESEKTPESVEVKALEDLKAEHRALRSCVESGEPSGRPASYGLGPDGAMNPFWSETAREEALLRPMRPLELRSYLPLMIRWLKGRPSSRTTARPKTWIWW